MPPTPFITFFENWVSNHRRALDAAGRVVFAVTPRDRPKVGASLQVSDHSSAYEVELLLWETGEAEFNRGPVSTARAVSNEHLDLSNERDLAVLLDRVLRAVASAQS